MKEIYTNSSISFSHHHHHCDVGLNLLNRVNGIFNTLQLLSIWKVVYEHSYYFSRAMFYMMKKAN